MTHPTRLRIDIYTIAIFIPKSCWSCVGSLETRDVRDPLEFSSPSKKVTGLSRIDSKYCWRYVHAMCYSQALACQQKRREVEILLTTEIWFEEYPRVKYEIPAPRPSTKNRRAQWLTAAWRVPSTIVTTFKSWAKNHAWSGLIAIWNVSHHLSKGCRAFK